MFAIQMLTVCVLVVGSSDPPTCVIGTPMEHRPFETKEACLEHGAAEAETAAKVIARRIGATTKVEWRSNTVCHRVEQREKAELTA